MYRVKERPKRTALNNDIDRVQTLSEHVLNNNVFTFPLEAKSKRGGSEDKHDLNDREVRKDDNRQCLNVSLKNIASGQVDNKQ